VSIVHACCERARHSHPVSTWDSSEFLDTAHAFTWSSWATARPDLAWAVFHAWASQGMVLDAASFGLLMMDGAHSRHPHREAGLVKMMEKCSAFEDLRRVFAWCLGDARPEVPDYSMRFDTRTCPGSCRQRGTHAKLSRLVVDIVGSGAGDAEAVLQAIREHSYCEGQWLKVAGGGKANLIESALRSKSARPGEVALEFGVFVGYTTVRIGHRSAAGAGRRPGGAGAARPLVVGLEVEPVHVCVARWMVDLARLSASVEVWAGIAHDLLLRVGDEIGARSTCLCFMDHRGTKFHEDLDRLERNELLVPGARIIADNVLKPSAPVFLWVTNTSPSYSTVNWAVGEFVQNYVEDWMVVSEYRWPGGRSPPPPAALLRLAWDSDKWRRKSELDSVRISEWAAFAKHARRTFMECGIEARPWFN